jgi:hypothetical protein
MRACASHVKGRSADVLLPARFIGLANATDSPQPGKGVAPQIRAVLRWAEELKRLAPSK